MKLSKFGSFAFVGLMAVGVCLAGDGVLNVRDFGAKGDGKTDDTAAIQKALDAAGAVSGTVFFPPGEYPCHDLKARERTCLKADPAWLFRNEKAGAVLRLNDDGARCLLDITGAYGAHLEGLFLWGNPKAERPVHGVLMDGGKFSPKEDSVVVDDVKIANFSGHGLYLNRVWLFIIRHSHFMQNKGNGVRIRGWDGFVTDNQISGNGASGFDCEDCGATIMFTANRVEWNRGYGVHFQHGDTVNVTGNCFDSNWAAGLFLEEMRSTAVTGNVFRRCGKDPSVLGPDEKSCQARLVGCGGITFTGNTGQSGRDDHQKGPLTPKYGLVLEGLQASVIKDNAFFNGYTDKMIFDLGGHGKNLIVKDNVGSP